MNRKLILPIAAAVLAGSSSWAQPMRASFVATRFGATGQPWSQALAVSSRALREPLTGTPASRILERLAAMKPGEPMGWAAPLVRSLEAAGYTPESLIAKEAPEGRARAIERAAAVASAEVATAAAELSAGIPQAELGSDEMVARIEGLGELSKELDPYLSEETKGVIRRARSDAARRLAAEGRGQVIGERMRRMAEALGGLPAPEAGVSTPPRASSPRRPALRYPSSGASSAATAKRASVEYDKWGAGRDFLATRERAELLREVRDKAYANRFAGIPGVTAVRAYPIRTYFNVTTRRTQVVAEFESPEALAAAERAGLLPAFGDLRGWITGYHVEARVAAPIAGRARDRVVVEYGDRVALDENKLREKRTQRWREARDRAYASRFAGIPGVTALRVYPITYFNVTTRRTQVVVEFESPEALAAARGARRLPIFGDLRGWITGYHVEARLHTGHRTAE